jgi:hypothetical protein
MHDLPFKPEGRYAIAIEVMQKMGWGWAQLQEAPTDLVEEIAFRMAQENKWIAKRRELNAQMNA